MEASTELKEPNYKLNDLFPPAYGVNRSGRARHEYEVFDQAGKSLGIFRTDDHRSLDLLENLAKEKLRSDALAKLPQKPTVESVGAEGYTTALARWEKDRTEIITLDPVGAYFGTIQYTNNTERVDTRNRRAFPKGLPQDKY
ncbi:MAG: hypothetical protein AABW82_00610 [Nanoarchaeota archaeon]